MRRCSKCASRVGPWGCGKRYNRKSLSERAKCHEQWYYKRYDNFLSTIEDPWLRCELSGFFLILSPTILAWFPWGKPCLIWWHGANTSPITHERPSPWLLGQTGAQWKYLTFSAQWNHTSLAIALSRPYHAVIGHIERHTIWTVEANFHCLLSQYTATPLKSSTEIPAMPDIIRSKRSLAIQMPPIQGQRNNPYGTCKMWYQSSSTRRKQPAPAPQVQKVKKVKYAPAIWCDSWSRCFFKFSGKNDSKRYALR
jgi:hypothetical protein